MESNLYKRNVLATVSVKPAQAGLRRLASNTVRVNVSHAMVGLAQTVSDLLVNMTGYILGSERWDKIDKEAAVKAMGDVGYYLAIGCKYAKVKLPGSGKKVKLVGMTRGKALMELNRVAAEVATVFHDSVYHGPVFLEGGKLIDKEATAAVEAERLAKVQGLLDTAVKMYWPLCYDMFQEPPAYVFGKHIESLAAQFGKETFVMNMEEAHAKDEVTKAEKLAAAAVKAAQDKKETAVAGSA
jgi:hypothetical protein